MVVPAVLVLVRVVVGVLGRQQLDPGSHVDGRHVRAVVVEVTQDVVDPRLEADRPVDEQRRVVDRFANPRPGLPPVSVLSDRNEQFGRRGVGRDVRRHVPEHEKRGPRGGPSGLRVVPVRRSADAPGACTHRGYPCRRHEQLASGCLHLINNIVDQYNNFTIEEGTNIINPNETDSPGGGRLGS